MSANASVDTGESVVDPKTLRGYRDTPEPPTIDVPGATSVTRTIDQIRECSLLHIEAYDLANWTDHNNRLSNSSN